MANIWVNRATVQVVDGVDAAGMTERFGSGVDFNTYADNAEWLYDPDLSAVEGFSSIYWIITGDIISLMDQAAIDVVDAAIEAVQLQLLRDQAISRTDLDITTRELVEALLFEINKLNTRMQEVQDSFTAMKNSAGGTDNLRLVIPDPSPTTSPAPTSFLNVNPKLRSQVLQAMVDDINAGISDP